MRFASFFVPPERCACVFRELIAGVWSVYLFMEAVAADTGATKAAATVRAVCGNTTRLRISPKPPRTRSFPSQVEVPHTESPPELPSEKEDKAEKGLRQGRQRQQQQQQPQPQQPRQRRRQHQPPLARVSKQGIEVYFPEPVASIVSFEGGSATSAGGGTFHENKTEAAVAADAGTPNKTSPAAPKNSSKCAGAPANARLIVGVVFCTVGWAWLFA